MSTLTNGLDFKQLTAQHQYHKEGDMPYDMELKGKIEAIASHGDGMERKKMFGAPGGLPPGRFKEGSMSKYQTTVNINYE
jgi:hypothetical protein